MGELVKGERRRGKGRGRQKTQDGRQKGYRVRPFSSVQFKTLSDPPQSPVEKGELLSSFGLVPPFLEGGQGDLQQVCTR